MNEAKEWYHLGSQLSHRGTVSYFILDRQHDEGKKETKEKNYIFNLGVNCGNPRQLAILLLVVSLNRVKKNEKTVFSLPVVNLVLTIATPTVSYFNPGS